MKKPPYFKIALVCLTLLCSSFYFFIDSELKGKTLTAKGKKLKAASTIVHHVLIAPAKKNRLEQTSNRQNNFLPLSENPDQWLSEFKLAFESHSNDAKIMLKTVEQETQASVIEMVLNRILELTKQDLSREFLENKFILKLIELEPAKASDYITKALQESSDIQLQRKKNELLITALMQKWGKQDLHQAVSWALTISDELTKSLALSALTYTNNENSLNILANEINQLPDGYLRQNLLSRLVQQKLKNNPVETRAWAYSLTDEKERSLVVAALIDSASLTIEDTTGLIEDALLNDMQIVPSTVDKFIIQWQNKNHDEAISWASNLPDSPIKLRALSLLIGLKASQEQQVN